MDPASLDPKILAQQLYKPEGKLGEEVGDLMAKRHVQAMEFTFRHLKLKPNDHVLEIGFGPGEAIAQAVKQTPKGFVAGLDFSDAMLAMAKQRNANAIKEKHAELKLGDAQHISYDDESFDKVFAMNVFHFWQEPQKELAECKRVLKSGGQILFYLTHHSDWLPGLKESSLFIALEPEEVENELKNAGFKDVHSHMTSLENRQCFVVIGRK